MNLNYLFRPASKADLPSILAITKEAGVGFNALPFDEKTMQSRVLQSVDSFKNVLPISDRYYFFVLEKNDTHEIIGTSGIELNVGARWPFYKYRLSTIVQTSELLKEHQPHQILSLVSEHQGTTEWGALYLKPAYRGERRGTFLSRARGLFIAQFSTLFSDRMIADMRGVSDTNGISPFWESVGKHFLTISYEKAAYLRATVGSQFLVDLMPLLPLYVDLLPKSAIDVIGKTHEQTKPALHVLEKEGFIFEHYIDLFDAGPTIEAKKQNLKTVLNSKVAKVSRLQNLDLSGFATDFFMISNTQHDFFKATLGILKIITPEEIILDEHAAKRLQVNTGDKIRYANL